MALLLIIIAPNGHILANIAIVSQFSLAIDLSSKGLPGQLPKKKLLKAKIAVALHNELGRVPKKEEIEQAFLLAKVLYKAVLGIHCKRQEQKRAGQLAIF